MQLCIDMFMRGLDICGVCICCVVHACICCFGYVCVMILYIRSVYSGVCICCVVSVCVCISHVDALGMSSVCVRYSLEVGGLCVHLFLCISAVHSPYAHGVHVCCVVHACLCCVRPCLCCTYW